MSENPTPPSPPPVPSSLHYSTEKPAAKRGNGSGWILALALIQFIGGLVMYAMMISKVPASDPGAIGVLITTVGLAAIFFGLWVWGRQHPFPALLTALIVFVTFHLLDAVFDPLSLLRGILMKIVIIVGLSTALKKAYVAKREKELAAPPVM
ncbi:MAG: hypothetical protein JNL92_18065 [Opitutaceae bacterium]|nr:hypothetical protein [Opitutaceae bacterium]